MNVRYLLKQALPKVMIMEVNLKTTRIALIAGLLATTLATTADAGTAKKNFRTGFYLGAEAGWLYDDIHFREQRTLSSSLNFNPALDVITQGSKKNGNSFLPGVLVGYRHFMDCYFLGLEFTAALNMSKAKSKRFTNDYSTVYSPHKMEGQYNLIPKLTFGRYFNQHWAVSAEVGMDFAKYKYKGREVRFLNGAITNKKSTSKHYNRILVGGTLEYAINCIWSTRLNGTYSFHKKESYKMRESLATNGVNDYRTRAKISSLALKVGLVAKF